MRVNKDISLYRDAHENGLVFIKFRIFGVKKFAMYNLCPGDKGSLAKREQCLDKEV